MTARLGGRARLLVLAALLSVALAGCAAPDATPPAAPPTDATADPTVACELDAVEPFAQVPAPGRPVGVAVHDGIAYVATGANFHFRPVDGDQRVFAFDPDGTLIDEVEVPMPPGATMGMSDLAVGSSDGGDRLYMVDMMGRVLRAPLGPAPGELGEPETYATIAATPRASMPAQMAFDAEGNAYLTDDFGRVWKIAPGGSASVWFESPRLQGPMLTGPSGFGVFGARFGPDGELYLSVSQSGPPSDLGAGIVYRIPVGGTPQEGDLEEVVRFPARTGPPAPDDGPTPFITGIAFGASGRLYVALSFWDEIAVVEPDGTVDRAIASPLLGSPIGLAFLGDELLVANTDGNSVLRVCVQEGGLPPYVPAGIP